MKIMVRVIGCSLLLLGLVELWHVVLPLVRFIYSVYENHNTIQGIKLFVHVFMLGIYAVLFVLYGIMVVLSIQVAYHNIPCIRMIIPMVIIAFILKGIAVLGVVNMLHKPTNYSISQDFVTTLPAQLTIYIIMAGLYFVATAVLLVYYRRESSIKKDHG